MGAAVAEASFEHALDAMRRAGLRVTRPRRRILRVLSESGDPLTPRAIHGMMAPDACDPVTVYRCLTEFERLGIVRRHEFGDGAARFQLVRPGGGHYHFIVCRSCQRTEQLDVCPPRWLEDAVRQRGYSDVSHTLEFFGLCPDCRGSSRPGEA